MKKYLISSFLVLMLSIIGCKTGATTDQMVLNYPNYDIKEDGLLFVDVKEGEGPEVKEADKVSVFYTGTLEDGTQFDTNVGGKPFVFTVGKGKVIQGWDEGLLGMKKGGVRNLVISSNKGYGSRGSGGNIPGSATLLFKVQLVEIN